MNTATRKHIEQEPFVLRLPEPFNMTPAYEIELPAKRKALIYDVTVNVRDYTSTNDNKYTVKAGWRVVVVTRTGRMVSPVSAFRNGGGELTFTEPLSLALHIKALAQEFSKTKKTTVEDTDLDE